LLAAIMRRWDDAHAGGPALLRACGFGMNFNEDKTRFWVSIHPGQSGLTHQQVLERLLGGAL
jgi:hypothetical protein